MKRKGLDSIDDIESILEDTHFYRLNHDAVQRDAVAIYRRNPTEEGLREADEYFGKVYEEWHDTVINELMEALRKRARNPHEREIICKLRPKYTNRLRREQTILRQEMLTEAIGRYVSEEQLASDRFADLLKDALA